MLDGRIPVLLKILEDFKSMGNPYIQERLCAVAPFGCFSSEIKKMSQARNLHLQQHF